MSKTLAHKKSSVRISHLFIDSHLFIVEASVHILMIDLYVCALTKNDRRNQVRVVSNQPDGRLFLSSVSSFHIQVNCLHLDHIHIYKKVICPCNK